MKLKTLEIENIASFEKALVDFDSDPLGDAGIFLINGETGSGKSTLLDAICLALYDDTPRMRAGGRGEKDNMPDNITYGNPMRLLRLNSDKGHVKLIFEADGDTWEALWAVRHVKTRNKEVKLNREWSLRNLRTTETMTKVGEISSTVLRLTGLDFGQFCRTTMLSQGEFAAFLKSEPDDKAALLQKITGLDKFEKTGKKIFAITSEKNRVREAAKERRDALAQQSLTAEQRAELIAQDGVFANRLKEVKALKERIEAASKWETKRAELAARLEKARRERTDAEERAKAPDTVAARADLKLYDATGTVRAAILAGRDAARRLAAEQRGLGVCRDKFHSLEAGLARLAIDEADTSAKLAATDADIASRRRFGAILDNASAIAGRLNNVAQLRKAVAAKEAELKKADKEIAEVITPRVGRAEALEKECSDGLAKLSSDLTDTAEKLAETDLAAMRAKKEELTATERSLDKLTAAVDALKRCDADIADRRKALTDNEAAAAKAAKSLETATSDVTAARAARDTCKKSSDAAQAAAGDAAEHLRASLRQGDHCPVCGTLIDHELTAGAILRDLAEKARREYERLEGEYDAAVRRQAASEGEIKSLARDKEKIGSELKRLDGERQKLAGDVAEKCAVLSIPADGNIAEAAAERARETASSLLDLSERIKSAEEIEKAVARLRAAVDKARLALDNAKKAGEKERKALTDARERREVIAAAIATNNDNIASALDELAPTLGSDNISDISRHDYRTEPGAFAADILAAARELTALTDRSTLMTKQLEKLTAALGRCRSLRDGIAEKLGITAAENTPAAARADAEAVEKDFYSLSENVTSTIAAIAAHTAEAERQKAVADSFFAANTDVSRETVNRLTALGDSDITRLRNEVESVSRRLIATETELRSAEKAGSDHAAARPADLIDENDEYEGWRAADLPQLKADAEKAEREAIEGRAGIKAALEGADKHAAELTEADAALAAATADHSRWEQLCRFLGDAEGKKFRRVAQSHLLQFLINGANNYLKHLNDRYELEVYPGTFTIMVSDSYQDYAKRTANTISGGETFLVSLALALALSDIGEMRGCDTLFIDEGFGSLSGEPLDRAVNTLKSLHHQVGRRIGIISHIASLREKIPTQIIVERPTGRAATLRLLP